MLTIFDKKGAVRVYQHFPENKNLGVIPSASVTRLVTTNKVGRRGVNR